MWWSTTMKMLVAEPRARSEIAMKRERIYSGLDLFFFLSTTAHVRALLIHISLRGGRLVTRDGADIFF